MKITNLGHASFKVDGKDFSIVFDPYRDGSVPGLTFPRGLEANHIFISHHHYDHDAVNLVTKLEDKDIKYKEFIIPHDKENGLAAGATDDGSALIYGSGVINANYTLHGGKYYFNGTAIIDWGTFINAVISFIIIAVVLFIIVKVVNSAQRKKEELKAKALEEYYEKHPEERPVPPEPGVPEPTETDLLKEILAELKAKKAAK